MILELLSKDPSCTNRRTLRLCCMLLHATLATSLGWEHASRHRGQAVIFFRLGLQKKGEPLLAGAREGGKSHDCHHTRAYGEAGRSDRVGRKKTCGGRTSLLSFSSQLRPAASSALALPRSRPTFIDISFGRPGRNIPDEPFQDTPAVEADE